MADAHALRRRARRLAGRVDESRPLRTTFGEGVRIFLDRPLPFLVLYRRPADAPDAGTAELATAPAAWVVRDRAAAADPEPVAELVQAVLERSATRFGGAVLVEIWSARDRADRADRAEASGVTVVAPGDAPRSLVEPLVTALRELSLDPVFGGDLGVPRRLERVELRPDHAPHPPGERPLSPPGPGDGAGEGVHRIGLEVDPFFRAAPDGPVFPRVLQVLRRQLTEALDRAVYVWSHEATTFDPAHPRALARRSIGKAARLVDDRLIEVSRAFDVLLQVTPVNSEEVWEGFRATGFRRAPRLRYRPLPFDAEELKRRLFHVPIERVEDPLLAHVFREKQEELDREITMLRELGTPRFRQASIALHGGPGPSLRALAQAVLERTPPPRDVGEPEEYGDGAESDDAVDAQAFARSARAAIDGYRSLAPGFSPSVEIRDDLTAGLMVSRGSLLVSARLRLPRERVDALVAHEVGTHLVTWWNGTQQPFRQFATGLAGYDPLQEGLAVLSEYLVGGLSVARFRILAARVVAVQSLLDGAEFEETFRLLHEGHGLDPRTAFVVTVRVHRGGGLTKDAAYLRGLDELLAYLRDGGRVDPLFVGKLGIAHTGVVQELVLRGILEVPRIRPSWMHDPSAQERLDRCRAMDTLDLLEEVLGHPKREAP